MRRVGVLLLFLGLALAVFAMPGAVRAVPTGLVAAYGFEETSGTTATDSSGSGNTGTLAGGAVSTTAGKFGRAISFDGVDDRVNVADSNSLDITTGMTLEAWVKPTGSGWQTALLKERPGGLAYALYASTDTGAPSAEIRTATSVETRGTGALPNSTWSHVAATYDRATLRLYVNGTQVSSRASTANIIATTGALRIGGNAVWGEYFRGLIDEVRVYNRALSASEIQADMNTPVIPGDIEPPSAPANAAANVTQDDVHLSWSTSTDNVGVTGYRVYRSNVSGFAVDSSTLVATLGNVATYDDLNRPPGNSYYRIVAIDAVGNASPPSNEAVATIVDPDAQPPTTPTSLTATVVNGNEVHLSWNASTDDLGVRMYSIYRSTTPNFNPYSGCCYYVTSVPGSFTSYIDILNQPGGTYYYKIDARDNSSHISGLSNEASATLDADVTPPTITIDEACDGSTPVKEYFYVHFTARDDRGAMDVRLEVEGHVVASLSFVGSGPVMAEWTTRSSWMTNGLHVMTAVVRDAAGHETVSAPCTWNVQNPVLTAPITYPADGATVSGVVTITGETRVDGQPKPITYPIAGAAWSVDGAPIGSRTHEQAWDTTKVSNGLHTIKYEMYWMDYGGPLATSTIQVLVDNPPPPPPGAPTGLTATATSANVHLAWTASTGTGVSYRIHRSTTAGFTPTDTNQIATVTGTSYDDLNRPAGTFYYRVVAVDSGGRTSVPSNEVSVTVQPPPSGLVAAYGFEEGAGTTVNDSSGNGNTGTLSGGTNFVNGKFGKGLNFDGVDNLVTIADSNSLDLTTGMTLEAWVDASATNDWRTVMLKEQPGALAYALYAGSDTARPGIFARTSNEFDARGTAQLSGVWTHLAGTYDGSSLRLYVNGTLVSSRAVTGNISTSSGALRIGGNNVWGEWFVGQIDEVRIYNRALSAAEIVSDRDRPVVPGS